MFQADSLRIEVILDNWVDMLLEDGEQHVDGCVTGIQRMGIPEHLDPKNVPPVAEFGISLLLTTTRGKFEQRTLFDVGLTGHALEHNLAVLRKDPATFDQVVISHGHPDHYGGINRFLELAGRTVPVVTHPDAFLPRFLLMNDGRSSSFYNRSFNQAELEEHGARLVLTKDPLDLGWGIYTTGMIPRENGFEGPAKTFTTGQPGLYQVSGQGDVRADEVWDEQALVIDVKGEGLVVVTGCSHSGVVNTVSRARAICSDKPIRAVVGGFHLGSFPLAPAENVAKTADAFQEFGVRTIVPMHCSGLRTHATFSQNFSDRYVQPSCGTTLSIGK